MMLRTSAGFPRARPLREFFFRERAEFFRRDVGGWRWVVEILCADRGAALYEISAEMMVEFALLLGIQLLLQA